MKSVNGLRHYVFDKEKLPSVTTILDQTQPPEKREALLRWRQSKGEEEATRIVDESAARGTAMHKILEMYILEQGYLDETNVGKQAHNMALQVINGGSSQMLQSIMAQSVLCTTQVCTQAKQI